MSKQIKIFSGSSNPKLARQIAKNLRLELGNVKVSRFSDGEVNIVFNENLRGQTVYLVQSLCTPVNDHLMELLLMADAARRGSASEIVAIIPYFGYARQDRRSSARVPISARVVADMISAVKINRVMTMDLHVEQVQGFFNIPVDNIYASKVLVKCLDKNSFPNPAVTSPDIGGVARARAVAKLLQTDLVIVDKRRDKVNHSEVMNIIGDPQAKTCVLFDDIADTAGTLCNAAVALKKEGARNVVACITHPVLSGNAVSKINASQIDKLFVTNTIPVVADASSSDKIEVVDVSEILANAIKRQQTRGSISELFSENKN